MSQNHRHSKDEDFLPNQQQHEGNKVDRCKNKNNYHKETSNNNNENDDNDDVDETVITLRCIEFYSGVGGWTMALQQVVKMLNDMIVEDEDIADNKNDSRDNCEQQQEQNEKRERRKFQLHCCAHLDHSDLCNDVYQYNHCCKADKKKHPIRIETLTVEQIIEWNASIWMMSPPCQPHTRQRQQPLFPNVLINNDNSTTESPPISLQNNEEEEQQQQLEQDAKTGVKRKKYNEIDDNSNNTSNSTNNGNSNGIDVDDIRSNSFLYLCTLLQSNQIPKQYLPKIILLENVIGFEQSKSCLDYWLPALRSHNYRIGQFTIQPTQVNIPNDRPRYYCVAVLLSDIDLKQRESNLLCKYLKPVRCGQTSNNNVEICNYDESTDTNLDHVLITSIPELDVMELPDDSNDATNKTDASILPEIRQFMDEQNNDINYDDHDDISKHRKLSSPLVISDVVLRKRSSWCMDIVKLTDRRSSCFTSAYGKYSKGTGSVLLVPLHPNDDDTINNTSLLLSPETREYNPNWADELCLFENSTLSQQEQNATTTNGPNGSVVHDRRRRRCMLRYFSGIEIARLMGFPSTFEFPSHITMKQQWKLIGNSLNVQVAAKFIELALHVQYNIPTTSHQSATSSSSTTS